MRAAVPPSGGQGRKTMAIGAPIRRLTGRPREGLEGVMATINGRSGHFKGVSIPLPAGGLTLGREQAGKGRLSFDGANDISRAHCSVQYDEHIQRFRITDLGSSNGTFLMPDDRRLGDHEEVQCEAGQLIRLGQHNVFELTSDKAVQGARRTSELPRLADGQRLDLAAIRVPYERFYFVFVCMPTVVAALALVLALIYAGASIENWLIFIGCVVLAVLMSWIWWKLLVVFLLGHAIRVGPTQYPQIDSLVSGASAILGITAPTVFILQGHGLFEIFVARRFSRRGVLIVMSTMLDDLTENGSSRELMFFIGRQLGLIAVGYFDLWFFKHTLGRFANLFYLAWQRRCHLTADRLGLLVTGELQASEQALLIITAGSGVAANTNIEAIKEQRAELFGSVWSWIALGLSSYPYMVDRIIRLRDFAAEAARLGIESNAPVAIGALPIHHHAIRALPLMIVHGHDRSARLELENFLRRKFPHVEPVLMIDETDAASTLPEKFERLARGVKGALVLLTPDDLAMARADLVTRARARQNVIVEIAFIWARFGRQRLLLLTHGDLEIPSDLSGVEVHRYATSPIECSEVVRDFISSIEMQ